MCVSTCANVLRVWCVVVSGPQDRSWVDVRHCVGSQPCRRVSTWRSIARVLSPQLCLNFRRPHDQRRRLQRFACKRKVAVARQSDASAPAGLRMGHLARTCVRRPPAGRSLHAETPIMVAHQVDSRRVSCLAPDSHDLVDGGPRTALRRSRVASVQNCHARRAWTNTFIRAARARWAPRENRSRRPRRLG